MANSGSVNNHTNRRPASVWARLPRTARVCVLVEPFWAFPAGLTAAYASVFQLRLGLSPVQVGTLATIVTVLGALAGPIGGYASDRFGRRYTLLVTDLIGWSVASVVYALSRSFWHLLAASLLSGFTGAGFASWNCLLADDTSPEDRAPAFTMLHIISLLSGMAVPVGALFVKAYGLIPAARGFYGFMALVVTAMFIARHFSISETSVGVRRRKETRSHSLAQAAGDIAASSRQLASNRAAVAALALWATISFHVTLVAVYFPIYASDHVGIAAALLSVFPGLSSLLSMIIMFGVMPKIVRHAEGPAVTAGLLASAAGMILVMTAPVRSVRSMWWLVLASLCNTTGTAVAMPILTAQFHNSLPDAVRAQSSGLVLVALCLAAAPAGVVGGKLYSVDPRLPFALLLLIMVASSIYRTMSAGASRPGRGPGQAQGQE